MSRKTRGNGVRQSKCTGGGEEEMSGGRNEKKTRKE
jgi:hypothetical protein